MEEERPQPKPEAPAPMSSRDAYFAARTLLRAQVDAAKEAGDGATVTIPAAAAKELLRAYPPHDDLPKSHCMFAARFVPFSRHAISDEALEGGMQLMRMGGITVSPHPAGGVVLAASSGRVLLLARDPEGRTSEGGVRLLMPDEAMDACAPAKPAQFADQGDVFEAAMPAWMEPGSVLSAGASLMVTPKEQPPDPGRHEQDGVMLWAGGIETSNHWRKDDARRLDPVKWWVVAQNACDQWGNVPDGPSWMASDILSLVTAAMRAVPDVHFWQSRRCGPMMTVWVPTEADDPKAGAPRSDVVIIAAGAQRLLEMQLPSWIAECAPEAAKPDPA
jgi:hypothetical protein